jgi:hypothetical protein
MAGILGGGKTKPIQQPKPVSALRVQTSVQGKPRAIGWGQTRMAGNLIWFGNFQAVAHTTAAAGGGKGGGKKKGATQTTYTYQAAMAFGLCEGPILAVIKAWNNKTPKSLSDLNLTAFLGDYAQSGWGYLADFKEPFPEQRTIPLVAPYQIQVQYHSPPVTVKSVLDANGVNYTLNGAGGNSYTLNSTTGVLTFNSLNAGSPVTISYSSANAPSQQLNYRGLAYTAAGPLDLGDNAEVPSLNFEVLHKISGAAPGVPDANAADVVKDFLTNVYYGVGFPAARISSLLQFDNYTQAMGLFVSPLLAEESDAAQFIKDLCAGCNSEPVWSSGKLDIVPYGDQSVSANGANFIPNLTPIYSLTSKDFLPVGGEGDPPVQINRRDPLKQFNDIRVEYLNRGNDYNVAIAPAKDEAGELDLGNQPMDVQQWHFFCLAGAANQAAQLLLGRQQVNNTYTFRLGAWAILPDPMDLLEITEPTQGLLNYLVRIKEITEGTDSTLTFVCEDCMLGSGTAPLYGVQAASGYVPNYNVNPPPTNPPIIFAGPPQIAQRLELWMVVSGPEGWGGVEVWVSNTGDSYERVGIGTGPCRQGVLTAPLPAGSDPDTMDTISVDLTMSEGELLSGTVSDANQFNTLCYVDGEFVSYQNAILTSAFNYDLTTYLRRGLFGTPIASHAIGSDFARLDQAVFKWPYTSDQIGQPLYVKMLPYNVWGGGGPELDAVSPIVLTVPPPPAPQDVTGFLVEQRDSVVAFKWDPILSVPIKGFDIGYAPQGSTDWSDFILLTEAAAGSEMTNASVPPGTWTFGIRALDIADQYSQDITTADLTVENTNLDLLSAPENPEWPGDLFNLVRHWTGVLVPDSTHLCSFYGWEVFDDYVPDPVATAYYTSPTRDTGFDGNDRVFSTMTTVIGPGDTGPATAVFKIDTWKTGEVDPNTFTTWTVGFITMRYIRSRIELTITADHVPYIQEFTPFVDATPLDASANGVVVTAPGTPVTFAVPFHDIPYVNTTAIDDTGLYATASDVSETGFTAHVWRPASGGGATAQNGVVNWTANGF